MKIVAFLATLPGKMLLACNHGQEKPQTLIKFIEGARTCGDQAQVHDAMTLEPCDVAMMLGWVHEDGKRAPHLTFRQQILDQQQSRSGRVVVADSNLFLYKDVTNPHHYLRYSFDGVFPDTGEYCDQDPDPARWSVLQRDLGVCLQPWRTHGKHILLCLQREGGWSMTGRSVLEWTANTIVELRKHTDRPIRVRAHPGDKKARNYIGSFKPVGMLRHVNLSDPQSSLLDDLRGCWAVVNHNSSPAVAAAIEGVPVFVTDPIRSQAREVANTDLSLIETPNLPDREAWVRRLAQFHWSHEDLASGRCWQHMRQWVNRA